MQKLLTQGKLLENGRLAQAGYSTSTVRQYDRKDIRGHKWRIKEWDYYIVTDGKKAVALTVADNSYMSLVSASFLYFEKPLYKTTSEMKFFTFGKLNLPSCPETGNVDYASKKVKMSFEKLPDRRILQCAFEDFWDGTPFECYLELTDFPKDQMTIATPFRKKHAFYYNTKINCMRAKGYCVVKGMHMSFDESDSLGTLDWGRGIWTYKNTWYWSSLQNKTSKRQDLRFQTWDTASATLPPPRKTWSLWTAWHTNLTKWFLKFRKKNGKDDFLSPWDNSRQRGTAGFAICACAGQKRYHRFGRACIATASGFRTFQRNGNFGQRQKSEDTK